MYFSLQSTETWSHIHHPPAETFYGRGDGVGRLQNFYQASSEECDGTVPRPVHAERGPASSSHADHAFQAGLRAGREVLL